MLSNTGRLFQWSLVVLILSLGTTLGAEVAPTSQEERLIPLAPCRLLDTRVSAPENGSDEVARQMDVASTRCGRIVPAAATAYAIRITPYRRSQREDIPPAGQVSRRPVAASLSFAVPPNSDIAVDLEGFYVSPGTPIDLREFSTAAGNATSEEPGMDRVIAGTAGEINLDATAPTYTNAGVLAIAKTSASPWVIMRAGESGGIGGFKILNSSDTELMRIETHGVSRLPASYLSARTDYRESQAIANNVVHEVKIVNPRDAANSAATPVVFFDAQSDDEVGSPRTTKFRAYTHGYYGQEDINFDSQIRYHFPQFTKYHFRAFSTVENKATFWVKTATSFDAVTQTRADMYVSGNVGIGTSAPTQKLEVVGNAKITGNLDVTGSVTGLTVVGAVYQDLAEWVPATKDMPPGTVVVLNPEKTNEVMPSSSDYDVRVAGVVSAQPGIILGRADSAKEMIATTGRVKVKVDATRAPIHIGDLLVSSTKSGLAMKSIPVDVGGIAMHRPGTIIGKALEPLASGEGEILVLLSLQ